MFVNGEHAAQSFEVPESNKAVKIYRDRGFSRDLSLKMILAFLILWRRVILRLAFLPTGLSLLLCFLSTVAASLSRLYRLGGHRHPVERQQCQVRWYITTCVTTKATIYSRRNDAHTGPTLI